jgi:ribosomal protein L7Ae-like RNA K-turn-binding protein
MNGWRRNSEKVKDRLFGVLGICHKAGKLLIGFDPVRDAARQNQLALILLSSDLSPKSAKEISFAAEKHHIHICTAPVTMDELAFRLGKRSGIIGITDRGLADAVRQKINSAAPTEEEACL